MQETLTDKWVKTRKPHKCYGCLKTFPIGTEMRLNVSVDKEGINRTYLCQHCDNHWQRWTKDDREETFPGDIGYWKNDQWYPKEQEGVDLMFNFETIKPQYDVLAWMSENDVTFYLEFSDPNLQKSVQEELKSKGFSTIHEFTTTRLIQFRPPSGMDTLQVLERICTTLELEHYKVQRKIVPRWKLSQDVLPIQSFILGVRG